MGLTLSRSTHTKIGVIFNGSRITINMPYLRHNVLHKKLHTEVIIKRSLRNHKSNRVENFKESREATYVPQLRHNVLDQKFYNKMDTMTNQETMYKFEKLF